MNASRCEINEILDAVPLDMLQFHGDESPAQCEGFHRPWYKALRVGGGGYSRAGGALCQRQWHSPRYLCRRRSGGTGECFDWSLIPPNLSKPLILAGGLTADNVEQAIAQVRPYAVDVSGGWRRKGIKDAVRVETFVRRVRSVM